MSFVIGVDGGGTKTLALVSDLKGHILGFGHSGPSNYHIVGIENAKKSIREAVERALVDSGYDPRSKARVACYGLAGLDSPRDFQIVHPHLEALGLAEKVVMAHDSHIALMGATAGKPGVIVIAGTGSVAAGIDEKGRYVRSGGWGPVIGDEGSAYFIGREAIVAALRYYDGRGPETRLLEAIKAELGLKAVEDIIGVIYGRTIAFSRIASIAPLVSRLAKEGDKIAADILVRAGKELATLAVAIIRRLRFEDREFPLAIIGGAFKAGPLLVETFRKEVLKAAPKAQISKPRLPPVVGAVLIALREAGLSLTDEIIENVERSWLSIKSRVEGA